MTDNIRHTPVARKAGRGFLRALRGIFGGKVLRRAAESLEALKQEFAAGRAGSEGAEETPRRIPHRDLRSGPIDEGAPYERPPSSVTRRRGSGGRVRARTATT